MATREVSVPMAPVYGEFAAQNFGCDMAYYQFFDGDKRADELVKLINERYEGICARVVPVPLNKHSK